MDERAKWHNACPVPIFVKTDWSEMQSKGRVGCDMRDHCNPAFTPNDSELRVVHSAVDGHIMSIRRRCNDTATVIIGFEHGPGYPRRIRGQIECYNMDVTFQLKKLRASGELAAACSHSADSSEDHFKPTSCWGRSLNQETDRRVKPIERGCRQGQS